MAGPNHSKATVIERGDDGGDAQPFGDSDDAGVHQAEPEIRIPIDEFDAAGLVNLHQVDAVELAGGDRVQERRPPDPDDSQLAKNSRR